AILTAARAVFTATPKRAMRAPEASRLAVAVAVSDDGIRACFGFGGSNQNGRPTSRSTRSGNRNGAKIEPGRDIIDVAKNRALAKLFGQFAVDTINDLFAVEAPVTNKNG